MKFTLKTKVFNITCIDQFLSCGAILSLSNQTLLIGWGKRQILSAPLYGKDIPCFYFPNFFLDNPGNNSCLDDSQWFIHEFYAFVDKDSLIELLKTNPRIIPKRLHWENQCKRLFEDAFYKLQQLFISGKLQKAVPFISETSPGQMSENQLYHSLLSALCQLKDQSSSVKYLYGFWSEKKEGMLGITPEILFHFTGEKTLETMACAGTIPIQQATKSIMNHPKELKEHQLVIEGIIDSLNPYGKIDRGETQIRHFPTLAHLITPLSVIFEEVPTFDTLIKALHPTPALGAFPKKEGMKWLMEYEKILNRKRFGAPVGYFQSEISNSQCNVAIRNVQWDTNRLTISAGCGVIQESSLGLEWDEINLKLKAIKETLSL